MTRKQLLITVVVLALLAAAGLWLMQSQRSAWKAVDERIGKPLAAGLQLSEVAEIALHGAGKTLTLKRGEEQWLVKERADFPADAQTVREMLLKLTELKIVQADPIAEKQRKQLNLLEPAAGSGEGSGTVLELRDSKGKPLARLLLGKSVITKSAGAAIGPEKGTPSGRYVVAGSDATTVLLISDSLDKAQASPEAWLSKELVRVDRAKSIAASGPDGTQRYAMSRDTESADWKLAGTVDKPESGKLQDVVSALYLVSLADVEADAAKAAEGMKSPVVVKVQTFDDVSYTIRIGAKAGEDRHYLTFAVSGEPPAARRSGKKETAEEKEQQDKTFAERRAKLLEKIAREKALERWTYLVTRSGVQSLLREQKEFMPEKKAASAGKS